MRGQNAYKTVQKTQRGEVSWEIEEQMVLRAQQERFGLGRWVSSNIELVVTAAAAAAAAAAVVVVVVTVAVVVVVVTVAAAAVVVVVVVVAVVVVTVAAAAAAAVAVVTYSRNTLKRSWKGRATKLFPMTLLIHCLTFRHHASYIYRRDVPLLLRTRLLHIQSTNIFHYFF